GSLERLGFYGPGGEGSIPMHQDPCDDGQLFLTGRGGAHLPAPTSAPFPPGPRRAGVIAARRWLRVALDRRA
ncbi:MAG TPA: hypothetical protein VLY63_05125, partial [Anaerolineae bacterium]|nr:hypothetical protein [Anaerolineae bacterium]